MNLRRSTLPLLLLFLVSGTTYSQQEVESNLSAIERQAQKAVDNRNWREAVPLYSKLLKENPKDHEFNFGMGLSVYKSGIRKERAEVYLENVDAEIVPEKNYFYGLALLYNGKFDEAIKAFEDFKPLIGSGSDGDELKAEIENYISHATNGKKLVLSPKNLLVVELMDRGINSETSEYAPVFYDENTLIFTEMNYGYEEVRDLGQGKKVEENIKITTYDMLDDKWSVAFKPSGDILHPGVNHKSLNTSSLVLSSDNSKFYFYKDADIWVSENKQEPQKRNVDAGNLKAEAMSALYTNKEETHRFMVTDVLELGPGGLDIYVSIKENDGSWSNWELVEGINTPFDEDSPYLASDGTLFFSSNGPQSMGGHDIFMAPKKTEKTWGKPVNMGVPINSPANDIHFVPITAGADEFFLASDRAGGVGNTDIYHITTCYEIPSTTVKGRLLASDGTPKANLVLFDIEGQKVGSAKYDDKSGDFEYDVNTGKDYELVVVAENYLNDTTRFFVPEQCSEYDLYQNIKLQLVEDENGVAVAQNTEVTNAFYDINKYRQDQDPDAFIAGLPEDHRLKPETVISSIELEGPVLLAAAQFKDVRFGFDSDKIDGAAKPILSKVAEFLNTHDGVTVVLEGHTDTKGPSWYNKGLSKRRANSVAKELRAQGVDKSRIIIKHYGEEKPVVEDYDADGNYIEDAAAQNRRVEIEVVLPDDE